MKESFLDGNSLLLDKSIQIFLCLIKTYENNKYFIEMLLSDFDGDLIMNIVSSFMYESNILLSFIDIVLICIDTIDLYDEESSEKFELFFDYICLV